MHCKTCDYPLWNITSNKCPECGGSFCPSDYEFVPNSVRFCCPHCQQTYFGTNPKGHLEPADFACVSCHNQIHMDQMVLLPAEGVKENWTKPDVNPWLERKSRGLFKAWLASVSRSLTRPSSMMKSLGDVARVGDACKFALFNLAMILTLGIGLVGGIVIIFQSFWQSSGSVFASLATFASVLAVYSIIYLLGMFLWVAIAHGILRLTKRATYTIGKTTEAILYSSGVMGITAVPLIGPYCGNYVALIWWIVCAAIMVTVAQKVKGSRAALSVIAFPATVFVLLVASYIAVFYFAISQSSRTFSTARMQALSAKSAYDLTVDILSFTQNSNGVPPAHSILLLENPNSTDSTAYGKWITSESQFVGQNTVTILNDIPVGDITLADFQIASKTQRQDAVRNVLDSMPDNVIAHRFGDYVFTYHGANLTTTDPKLWVVLFLPDPDTNATPTTFDRIEVGLADMSTYQFPAIQLATEVQSQNKLRANLGLPPLPDLSTVTHSNPAVAESEDGSD